MTNPRVLIVGAGPTGLTAAVELARRGIMPVVIEKRKSVSHLSRAVGILPRSMDILGPSGVAKAIRAEAITFRRAIFHTNGEQLASLPLNSHKNRKNRLFGLPQDQTELHLRNAFIALGGKINYGAELLSLSQSDAGISVSILGKAFRFDTVIGADGTNSTVRETMRIPYNGYELAGLWSIADVDAVGWKAPRAFQGYILDQGGVVVVVPLTKNRFRVIANRPYALASLPVPMNIAKLYRAANFTISVRQAETYQIGHVFLAGDAAHCHSPVGGRGMNLGIADAADLAERIVNGTTDGYHAARHPVGRATIKQSERARRIITSTHPAIRFFLRSFLQLARHSPLLQRRFLKNALDL
ncbi:MAG: FAD-dependent monooxygenase [Proteobacteria bacterium]|nr:FAD-dependent monooxygenase [Pseudomonadota bacterium]